MKTQDATSGSIRIDRNEIAGSLGDLGTFIPLLVGMVNRCGLQLCPALLFAGVMNIASGLLFRIPMPVQPMKAIATVAIAEGLSESQILTAGITTGAIIFLLAVTGLIDWLNRVVPKSVVRGLQLALALKLIFKGAEMVMQTGVLIGWDSVGLGLLCLFVVAASYRSRRFPAALVIFLIGVVVLLAAQPGLLENAAAGFDWKMPSLTHLDDWTAGLLRGAIPQVPLTTLNSVLAVCALSCDLFPDRKAAPRRVAVSVALMNLITCPFGAMPMCHGAGGLAAQYRFGARTGGSVIFLGACKCVLAIALGGSLLVWLQAYPASVLGVLLIFSGIELGAVCRDQRIPMEIVVLSITAAGCLVINTAAGFAIGFAVAILLRSSKRGDLADTSM